MPDESTQGKDATFRVVAAQDDMGVMWVQSTALRLRFDAVGAPTILEQLWLGPDNTKRWVPVQLVFGPEGTQ